MAVSIGTLLVLQIDTETSVANPATYVTIGGMRTKGLKIVNPYVDITNDSSGGWRESLPGVGLRQITVSGSGVYSDDAGAKEVDRSMRVGSDKRARVIVPNLGSLTGTWVVSEYAIGTGTNKELTFTVTLESNGPIVFVSS